MNLTLQRRLASKILKCGEGRVWIDPAKMSQVDEAITREDVRKLIGEGAIKAKRKKRSNSQGKRQPEGSRLNQRDNVCQEAKKGKMDRQD